MIWYGVISEVKDAKARVAVGELTTDYLPVFQIASSFKRSWVPIREKEQCVILSPSGDINAGCILRGIYHTAHPAPGTDKEVEITEFSGGTQISYSTEDNLFKADAVFSDGTQISYSTKDSLLKVDVVKDIKIICKSAVVECEDASVTASNGITAECTTANITASNDITVACNTANIEAQASAVVTTPSLDLGGMGGGGVVTQECICSLTGLSHPDASTIVRAIK